MWLELRLRSEVSSRFERRQHVPTLARLRQRPGEVGQQLRSLDMYFGVVRLRVPAKSRADFRLASGFGRFI